MYLFIYAYYSNVYIVRKYKRYTEILLQFYTNNVSLLSIVMLFMSRTRKSFFALMILSLAYRILRS